MSNDEVGLLRRLPILFALTYNRHGCFTRCLLTSWLLNSLASSVYSSLL